MSGETWLTWPEALASLMWSDGSLLNSVREDESAYLGPAEGQCPLIARAVVLMRLEQDDRLGPLAAGNMWTRQAESHLFSLLEVGDAQCLASLVAGGLRDYSPRGVEWRGVRCTVADDAFVIERIGPPSRALFYDPVFSLPQIAEPSGIEAPSLLVDQVDEGSPDLSAWAKGAIERGIGIGGAGPDARDQLGDAAPPEMECRAALKAELKAIGQRVQRGRPRGSKSWAKLR